MNKHFIKLCALVALCTPIYGCLDSSLNDDPDKVHVSRLAQDNLYGTYLTTLQRNVVAEDQNDFQLTEDLFGNMYAGYYAGTQSWEGGYNATTYVFPDGWKDRPFSVAYTKVMSNWQQLRLKTDSSSVLFAVGEVVKVEAMHKTTDIYGPIPYTRFGLQTPVPYDSQKDVYMRFFSELDHAIGVLTAFDRLNPSAKPLSNFDLIYGSDLKKWIRFANSLKLRLAIRCHKAYDGAQALAEAAVNNDYGVIEENEDNAVMQTVGALSFTYNNPFYNIYSTEGYNEDRMGASMDAYLNGFSDPRLSKFFAPAIDGQYRGMRNGMRNGKNFQGNEKLSAPTITRSTPYVWMNAAEMWLLRAEGALLGWNMGGTAKDLYEEGVRTSLAQHGLSDSADNYLASTNTPSAYDGMRGLPAADAPSDITPAWDDNATDAKKLERIITQKWIAIYPLGQEAWSEFRRTGYPKLFPVVDNFSNGKVNTNIQVRRVPFPASEYIGNKAEVEKAVQLLGGEDTGGTSLWWDKQ